MDTRDYEYYIGSILKLHAHVHAMHNCLLQQAEALVGSYIVVILWYTSRYPVGITTEFCFRWQKNLQGGKGKGIRGEKEKKTKKNWGKN